MRRQALGRNRTIRDRKTLELTLRAGEVVRTPYFTVRYRAGEGPPGVAFLAGRKVGKANRRNRARRVLREAFRTIELDLQRVETLVFMATERAATGTYVEIKRSMAAALQRASDHTG